MSQLTIIEKEAFSKLSPIQRDYVTARQGKKLKAMSEAEKKMIALNAVTKAHFDSGIKFIDQKEQEDVLTFQTIALVAEFKGDLLNLTEQEVYRAFEAGIRQEYGQYFGICPKTYNQFLKGYFNNEYRTESQKQYLKLIEDENVKKAEKPLVVKLKETKASVIQAFEDYKKDGTLPFTSFAYYDFLVEQGKIHISKDDKKRMFAEAQTEYVNEMKIKKAQGLLKPDKYEEIIANIDGDTNRVVVNKAKRKALKHFFDSLLHKGGEIEI